jgi:hypothetical protein
MLKTIEGIYRNGIVELIEKPDDIPEESGVIVTFLKTSSINLAQQGINQDEAKFLRSSLSSFADDWNSHEMSIYDDYDTAKAKL